ncbi:hypothetical protein JOB18_034866 [Solea senegalensis]|uniref:Uncharacterized protein n=1 Tax=Solea senegalensis TaxID=28829 RepID=A0AAV6QA61_SOLSE|nr:hypothetical protein JOB18_034866 [Solea senegalensis]
MRHILLPVLILRTRVNTSLPVGVFSYRAAGLTRHAQCALSLQFAVVSVLPLCIILFGASRLTQCGCR